MKETSPSVRDGLIKMRTNLLHELVALARDRKRAEQILEQINTAEAALAAVTPSTTAKYGKLKSPILAILAYLEETGRPAEPDEIVRALAAGGFRGGDVDNVRTKVLQSINAGLTQKIKVVNGLVGLREWEKARFSA